MRSWEKIGRANLLASRHPSKSLPHVARREPRPPKLRWLNFFTPSGVGVDFPDGKDPLLKAEAFFPRGGDFQESHPCRQALFPFEGGAGGCLDIFMS